MRVHRWLLYGGVLAWVLVGIMFWPREIPRPSPVPSFLGDGRVIWTLAHPCQQVTCVIFTAPPAGSSNYVKAITALTEIQPRTWLWVPPTPTVGQWAWTRFYLGEDQTCGAHLNAAGRWQPFGDCWAWPARAAEGETIYGRAR